MAIPSKMSAFDLWKLNVQRLELIRNLLQDWERSGIDIILAPGYGMPAQPISYPSWLQAGSSYTCVYNMLDFPAGSLPVSNMNQIYKGQWSY